MLEGFGLTEFPVISLNRPGSARLGTVGHALPGIEVRTTESGEIVARGPSCMVAYHNRPEATAEAVDADGWFHTGDVGTIAPDGRISITDRIKDILVLANGKNVAPQPIEAALKQSPYVSEAVLFGDRQAVIVALIVPAMQQVRAWARESGLELPASDEGAVQDPRLRALIKGEIEGASAHLADFERVRRFALTSRPFTIDSGELTPTLKVKRRVVAERYAAVLAELSR
jgi:long-chain acyl-CoA synthetase